MVFYFVSSQGHIVYMGKDKFENEELLRFGWAEDVWFHVDDLSSAHVYLRLKKDETIETIPEEVLMECSQLVKENSIEGKKKDKVRIVYTPYPNLHKSGDMDIGAVGFHNEKLRFYIEIEKDKDILKKIAKTKEERHPNLQEEKEKRIQADKKEKLAHYKTTQKEKAEQDRKKREDEEVRNYNEQVKKTMMKSNKDSAKDLEDDFM